MRVRNKIAMHITASSPLNNADDIDTKIIDKEMERIKVKFLQSGKPAEMVDKISKGKIS